MDEINSRRGRWFYLGWEPPWNCEPGYFILAYEKDYGFYHLFLLGHHWIKQVPKEQEDVS